jgi:hypothetical protein
MSSKRCGYRFDTRIGVVLGAEWFEVQGLEAGVGEPTSWTSPA